MPENTTELSASLIFVGMQHTAHIYHTLSTRMILRATSATYLHVPPFKEQRMITFGNSTVKIMHCRVSSVTTQ
jgi:hypothetical protein